MTLYLRMHVLLDLVCVKTKYAVNVVIAFSFHSRSILSIYLYLST